MLKMMRCPACGLWNDRVVDTYTSKDAKVIRRRRVCCSCGYRYTTYESVKSIPIVVIKRNGSRQSFDRNKIIDSMLHACYKRHVDIKQIEECVDEIEYTLSNVLHAEVESAYIGRLVMQELKKLDSVAYVRYGSVYHGLKDVTEFLHRLAPIVEKIGKSGALVR